MRARASLASVQLLKPPACRRTSITMQKTELEQIESRLRAMEAELQAKRARLPSMSQNASQKSQNTSLRRQGLEGGFQSSAQKESPKKQMPVAAPTTLSPSRGSRARPPSSSSDSSTSSDSSDVSPTPEPQKVNGKSNKVNARNLPSRGRS